MLKDSQLPQLRNWEVGKTYKLEVEVEQLSLDAPDPSYGESNHWTARFRVKSVKPFGESGTIDEKSIKTEALKRSNKY